ncbi:nuclear transport factor 2 family protein [Streptomyces phaeochromogenes]|uniref:nuclear transport factor 2 family protein n=1 Tax=Streptomyces phaeochromogenes TaxID=1923 RepID=UPI002DDA4200|nr:nuclear transport factor 2 family protein [Streptomyces phaeochromogenes]WRZ27933.1 nuclear transport factor 2 family protein [Streptomyces phaeochromogenes]
MSDERKVQEVLARYVRAADRRDGKSQGALFTDDATVDVFVKTGPDAYEQVGEPIIGGSGVTYAVDNFMAPHPEGGSSHHVTADHLIEVDGDRAHMNAHFVVFEVRALSRPAGGWPEDAFGAQGTIRPIESGYYDSDLRFIDGEWKIVRHRVLHDMPYAVLEA